MLKEEFLFAGKYRLKRLLGRGGFSEVWLAEDTMTNVEVAVKVYASQARLGEEGIEIFRKEFALVFDLNHTNLLHPTYFDVWENMPYLILPYCKEGSVFKYISKGEQISEEQCWNILHDVAAGLAYMHDRTPPLIHQDIKPDNILISNEGRYMITDFGISTKVRNTMATIQNAATMSSGTLAYMGPERFSTKPKPLMASDVWSLGAMMYELMTGGNPPFGNHGGALQKGGAEIPEIEETQYSDQLKQMVYWCMAVNTWDRPVARAIEEITYKKLHNIDITADLAKAKQEQQQQPEPPKPQQQQQRPARPTTIGASQWQQGGFAPQPRFSGTYDRQPRMSGNYGPQPGGYDPNLSGTQMDRSHAGSVMPYGGNKKLLFGSIAVGSIGITTAIATSVGSALVAPIAVGVFGVIAGASAALGISAIANATNALGGMKKKRTHITNKAMPVHMLTPGKDATIYSSVYAPAEVKRRSHILIQVYLNRSEEDELISSLAQEVQPETKRRDSIPLNNLKEGEQVDVQLNIYGDSLVMTEHKTITWHTPFTKCVFDYFVPTDINVDELSCQIILSINGAQVGEMRFITKIVEQPRDLNPKVSAHQYKKIFISYAHQDEKKVKYLAEAYKAQGANYFFDRHYLKGGDVFPQVIQDYINSADLFILCWSENASKSEYVEKERTQALELAFPKVKPMEKATLSIYPMSIEPRAELPADMRDNYHFEEI